MLKGFYNELFFTMIHKYTYIVKETLKFLTNLTINIDSS